MLEEESLEDLDLVFCQVVMNFGMCEVGILCQHAYFSKNREALPKEMVLMRI